MTDTIEVMQEDREAAADVLDIHHMGAWLTDGYRSGECDDGEHVQAFARHRQQSTAPLVEAGNALKGYAAHDDGCGTGDWPPNECSCGYSAALSRWNAIGGGGG